MIANNCEKFSTLEMVEDYLLNKFNPSSESSVGKLFNAYYSIYINQKSLFFNFFYRKSLKNRINSRTFEGKK